MKEPDIVDRIADILIEDHVQLVRENQRMRERLAVAEGGITHRDEFEAEFPVPDDVYYNAKLDNYCWISYPNTPQPEYDAMWAAWQSGFSAGVRSAM